MMRRYVAVAAVSVLFGSLAARSETKLPQVIQVLGQVTAAARPVEDALIVAFGLKSFDSHQSFSDRAGAFQLASLPSDVYRIIAVKQGFAPAVATVVPSSADLRLNIRLHEGRPTAETTNQIWEIRRSLPVDVLRELDAVLGTSDSTSSSSDRFRFRGQMESLTGLASQADRADYSQAALELKGSSSNGWSVDIAGRMHQSQGQNAAPSDSPLSQSSGITMALQTSPSQSVRVSSTRNWARVQDIEPGTQNLDLESHRIEWNRADSNVEVRYMSQQNLFRSPVMNSETFAVAGRKQLIESDRGDWNVDFQVWQENGLAATQMANPYRIANLGTSGHFAASDAVDLHYGLKARLTQNGQQWAPETGAEIRLSKRTAFVVQGLYSVGRPVDSTTLPIVTSARDFSSISPRYRYSFGLISSDRKGNELSATMTVAALDSMINMLFDDAVSVANLWDGYSFQAGDLHRDVTVTFRRKVGKTLFVDVTTTAAQTESKDSAGAITKHFVVSNVRTFYRPTGTTMDVTYRLAQQPKQDISRIDVNGDRLNVRVAQSLHLPLDLRLLLGLDLARDREDSPFALAPELQRRYIGGLSLAF